MTLKFVDEQEADSSLDISWGCWLQLKEFLLRHGVNTNELKSANDGDLISAETCAKIAETIECHGRDELHPWYLGLVETLRNFAERGGCRQH